MLLGTQRIRVNQIATLGLRPYQAAPPKTENKKAKGTSAADFGGRSNIDYRSVFCRTWYSSIHDWNVFQVLSLDTRVMGRF